MSAVKVYSIGSVYGLISNPVAQRVHVLVGLGVLEPGGGIELHIGVTAQPGQQMGVS